MPEPSTKFTASLPEQISLASGANLIIAMMVHQPAAMAVVCGCTSNSCILITTYLLLDKRAWAQANSLANYQFQTLAINSPFSGRLSSLGRTGCCMLVSVLHQARRNKMQPLLPSPHELEHARMNE